MAKKGITAVIATVLLLMMTVAAAGVSYTWIMDMQKSIQKDTEEKYASDVAKTNAELNIDSMWKNGAKINFTLRNTGTYTFSNLSKFTFYVDGARIDPVPTASLTGKLFPGDIITITTSVDFPPVDAPKTIMLVAETGTKVTYRCKITVITQSYC